MIVHFLMHPIFTRVRMISSLRVNICLVTVSIEVEVGSLFPITIARLGKEQNIEDLILFFVVAAYLLKGDLGLFAINGRSLMVRGHTRKMTLYVACLLANRLYRLRGTLISVDTLMSRFDRYECQ